MPATTYQRRLTRLSGRTKLWVDAAKISTKNFLELEPKTNISFFDPVGVLLVKSDQLKDKYLESPVETLTQATVDFSFYPTGDNSWRTQFPDYDFPESHWLLHEAETAGTLNPRLMLKAQLELAKTQGATVIDKQVTQITEQDKNVLVTCSTGESYQAKKVLVTTGAFSNFFDLLPRKLDLTLKTETNILAEVSEQDAQRLKTIPTVSYSIEDPNISDIYLTPPACYENGRWYFKLGANTFTDQFPTTLEDVQKWFQSGDSDSCLDTLKSAVQAMLPKVNFLSFETKRCIITRTTSTYPMIDAMSDKLFVAVGGNGASAKTSDACGQIAAGLCFDGRWLEELPYEIPREALRVVYQNNS